MQGAEEFFKTPEGAKLIRKNKDEAEKMEVKEGGEEAEEEAEAQENGSNSKVAEAVVLYALGCYTMCIP